MQSKISGTSGSHQRVNPTDIINYLLPLPPDKSLIDYHTAIIDLLKNNEALRMENQKLLSLRDTLLPKLISGELQVAETQTA